MCLQVSYKKKNMKKNNFCCIPEERSRNWSWIRNPDPSVRGTDPHPHQNVTDPRHCTYLIILLLLPSSPRKPRHKPNPTTGRKPGPLKIIQYSLFLTHRYLEDYVETNEEELYIGDDSKACSSIYHSTLSDLDVQVPGRWRVDRWGRTLRWRR